MLVHSGAEIAAIPNASLMYAVVPDPLVVMTGFAIDIASI
jgi:hypothetical protein